MVSIIKTLVVSCKEQQVTTGAGEMFLRKSGR